MKKSSKSAPPAVAPGDVDLEGLARDAAVLFEHPNMVPGVPARGLSPREMIEATYEPRFDQTQDPHLFMIEEPLNAIGKKGVTLLRKKFTGLDLLPLTTGSKDRLRRDLVIRYNRAQLARGVLKEIVILERDPQGVYNELARATRSDLLNQELDNSVFLRERAHYVAQLVENVRLDAEQLLRIETGTAAVEDLVGAIRARERFQRRNHPDPVVSKPRFDLGARPSPEAEVDYGTMTKGRPDAIDNTAVEITGEELGFGDVIAGLYAPGPPAPRAGSTSRGRTKGTSSKKPVRGKKGSKARGSAAATPAQEQDQPAVPPLAGGSAGLADLLSSAPVNTEDDS
jgi:hypothetical protein